MDKKYKFILKTNKTNGKTFEREHYCADDEVAKNQLFGMMYALFFLYKHPYGEVWCDGKLVHSNC